LSPRGDLLIRLAEQAAVQALQPLLAGAAVGSRVQGHVRGWGRVRQGLAVQDSSRRFDHRGNVLHVNNRAPSPGKSRSADSLDAPNPQPIDAGLLDIRMPGLDGLAVLKRARESGMEVPDCSTKRCTSTG